MSSMIEPPLHLCIAGIGGYARNHHAVALELEKRGKLKLIATCDPRRDQLSVEANDYAFVQRGTAVLKGFDEMIACFARQSHFVSIATPIHLHATMHAAVVSLNVGCYMEKPPTLDPVELESMIEIERTSDFQTEVGFNYLAEDWRRDLKQRILEGEWGEPRAFSLYGAWMRDWAYYRRSPWAGKLLLNEHLVLDSCFGNAVSHNVHNLLFFAGKKGVFSWGEPREVRCELYRAYSIEGADTVFSEMTTEDGITLRVALSHACQSERDQLEVIYCDRAEIRIRPYQSVEILHHSGKREFIETDPNARLFQANFLHYLAYLQGLEERPLTGLTDCRPFVTWNALNYLASRRIQTIPRSACTGNSASAVSIHGIEDIMKKFLQTGEFPSEQEVSWSFRGGKALAGEVCGLRDCVLEIAEQERKAAVSQEVID